LTVVEQHIIACAKMLSFGFETFIKANSPLVKDFPGCLTTL